MSHLLKTVILAISKQILKLKALNKPPTNLLSSCKKVESKRVTEQRE